MTSNSFVVTDLLTALPGFVCGDCHYEINLYKEFDGYCVYLSIPYNKMGCGTIHITDGVLDNLTLNFNYSGLLSLIVIVQGYLKMIDNYMSYAGTSPCEINPFPILF